MRAFHRWLMTVLVVFLLYLAASGLTVALYDVADPQQGWAQEGGGPGMRESIYAAGALPAADKLETTLVTVTVAARRIIVDAPITSITLRMQEGVLQGMVLIGGDVPRQLLLSSDGELLSDTIIAQRAGRPASLPPDAVMPGGIGGPMPDTDESLHGYLESWHRMAFLGQGGGRLVGLLSALGLVLLVLSGLMVYLQLRATRQATGRRGFFWK